MALETFRRNRSSDQLRSNSQSSTRHLPVVVAAPEHEAVRSEAEALAKAHASQGEFLDSRSPSSDIPIDGKYLIT